MNLRKKPTRVIGQMGSKTFHPAKIAPTKREDWLFAAASITD